MNSNNQHISLIDKAVRTQSENMIRELRDGNVVSNWNLLVD